MKKAGIILLSVVCLFTLFAQDKLYIHKPDKSVLELLVSAIDSISFGNNQTELNIYKTDNTVSTLALSAIDSITIGSATDTVKINYTGITVTITNPFANSGVSVTLNGGDVTVNSSLDNNDIVYELSGTTTDGSFKIYNTNRFNLVLKALTINNSDGPAINIQSGKKVSVVLADGTTSSIIDGVTYASSTEDQKGAFFSEGQLVFSGNGALIVKSLSKHAICSDDYLQINSGNITVTGASKDGVHSKDYFRMYGGSLNVTAGGDGVECELGDVDITGGTITTTNTVADTKGICCDSLMTITGGTLNLTVGGNQAKGLKSKQAMMLSGGTITINTSGGVVLPVLGLGYDPSYCTGIKSSTNIDLTGANITIVSTGAAGKGISADGNVTMSAGTISVNTSGAGSTFTNSLGVIDSYTAAGIEADGNITIVGGSLTAICSGSGSKGISADGNLSFGDASHSPIVNMTNTGTKFLVSGTANYTTAVYSEPKAIKSDGVLNIANGIFTLSASQQGGNAIDCDSVLNITGGTIGITIAGNQSKGIKASRTMNLTGGTITIGATGGVVLELTAAAKYDPSYCAAIKGTEAINIGGSNITITSSGAAGKGITSDGSINMTSGTVKVTCSGTGTTYTNSLGATDSYNASCFASDVNLTVTGGNLTCSSSGNGGKAMSSNGTMSIGGTGLSPVIDLKTTGAKFIVSGTDYCHPKALVSTSDLTINNGTITISSSDDGIHSDKSITINGGSTTVSTSVEGIESLLITMNGGYVSVLGSDDGINATQSTQSGGTESTDASYFYMKGGIMITTATTGDAIDSNGNFIMTGGTLISFGPSNTTNEDIDVNGNILINGGTFFGACMSSGMFESITSSSTQVGVNLKSTSAVSTASTYLRVQDASGNDLCTVATPRAFSYFHFSSPSLKNSTAYYFYTGGTYTGGTNAGGYCTGGTYSGGTQKKTFTTGTSKITTISF